MSAATSAVPLLYNNNEAEGQRGILRDKNRI
jgi:hypothetical protein